MGGRNATSSTCTSRTCTSSACRASVSIASLCGRDSRLVKLHSIMCGCYTRTHELEGCSCAHFVPLLLTTNVTPAHCTPPANDAPTPTHHTLHPAKNRAPHPLYPSSPPTPPLPPCHSPYFCAPLHPYSPDTLRTPSFCSLRAARLSQPPTRSPLPMCCVPCRKQEPLQPQDPACNQLSTFLVYNERRKVGTVSLFRPLCDPIGAHPPRHATCHATPATPCHY